jgi:hypothetical protein
MSLLRRKSSKLSVMSRHLWTPLRHQFEEPDGLQLPRPSAYRDVGRYWGKEDEQTRRCESRISLEPSLAPRHHSTRPSELSLHEDQLELSMTCNDLV